MTWVTFYYQAIGYTLLTRSTLFTLNPPYTQYLGSYSFAAHNYRSGRNRSTGHVPRLPLPLSPHSPPAECCSQRPDSKHSDRPRPADSSHQTFSRKNTNRRCNQWKLPIGVTLAHYVKQFLRTPFRMRHPYFHQLFYNLHICLPRTAVWVT